MTKLTHENLQKFRDSLLENEVHELTTLQARKEIKKSFNTMHEPTVHTIFKNLVEFDFLRSVGPETWQLMSDSENEKE